MAGFHDLKSLAVSDRSLTGTLLLASLVVSASLFLLIRHPDSRQGEPANHVFLR